MDEQTLKDTVARNMIHYRKMNHLTQLELAEKLNYSDKSVSKWERAESIPDVFILHQLTILYGVTLNDFLSVKPKKRPIHLKTHRTFISLLSAGLVWLIAVLAFVALTVLLPKLIRPWLAFVYAVPVTAIVLLVLTGAWGNRWLCCMFVSVLIWSLGCSIYFSATYPLAWLIFIVAIPLQILTVLWFFFRRNKVKNLAP